MASHAGYFIGMMVLTLTSQMYHSRAYAKVNSFLQKLLIHFFSFKRIIVKISILLVR